MHELSVFCKLNRLHVAYFTIGLDLAFITVQHPINMDSFDFKNVPLDEKSLNHAVYIMAVHSV